jgi:peptidyl-tRNA hydrolase, PTH1 family
MVTAVLAERACGPGARYKANRSGNDIAEGTLAGVPVTLAWPRSFMNLSGRPVAALAAFYKIPPERLVVIHDELDIPFGAIRLKLGGGDNGHNGLRSVTQALGNPGYYRVRFGIGRPPGRMDAAVYVLRDFTAAERKELPLLLDRCADAAETLITKGLAVAQTIYHADRLAEA